MIEHCEQIVGEDPSSLFGGPPQRLDTEEMGSGMKYVFNSSTVFVCIEFVIVIAVLLD